MEYCSYRLVLEVKPNEGSQSDKLKHAGAKNRAKDKAHLKPVLDPKGFSKWFSFQSFTLLKFHRYRNETNGRPTAALFATETSGGVFRSELGLSEFAAHLFRVVQILVECFQGIQQKPLDFGSIDEKITSGRFGDRAPGAADHHRLPQRQGGRQGEPAAAGPAHAHRGPDAALGRAALPCLVPLVLTIYVFKMKHQVLHSVPSCAHSKSAWRCFTCCRWIATAPCSACWRTSSTPTTPAPLSAWLRASSAERLHPTRVYNLEWKMMFKSVSRSSSAEKTFWGKPRLFSTTLKTVGQCWKYSTRMRWIEYANVTQVNSLIGEFSNCRWALVWVQLWNFMHWSPGSCKSSICNCGEATCWRETRKKVGVLKFMLMNLLKVSYPFCIWIAIIFTVK